MRPWDRTLYIKVVRGFLREGDSITVTFGDRSQGSPGMRLQTFCEDSFEFHTLVDPIATYCNQPLPDQPTIRIVPGAAESFVAVVPTLRRCGEPFSLRFKGEDRWGNPSERCDVTFRPESSIPVDGLPETVRLRPGDSAGSVERLSVAAPGDVVIRLLAEDGAVVASANPLRIVAAADQLLQSRQDAGPHV